MKEYRIIGISHGSDGDTFTCNCVKVLDETKNHQELMIDARNALHAETEYSGVLDEIILVDTSLNIILESNVQIESKVLRVLDRTSFLQRKIDG